MIKDINAIDFKQFSTDIEAIKQEIKAHSNEENLQEGEDAMVLEVIDVIQEEISQRKGKMKKNDIKSDVRFLAYLNLFNTLMNEGFEEDFDEDDFDDEDFEDDYEDDEEEIER